MGNFAQNTLSFYHTFSKTQVNNTAPYSSLGNSINKSGHTVQASDVWADDIPFFAEKGTTGEVHSIFSAHAQTNDLVKVGSKIYQRNATPYTSGATFETLWSEKTKSITDWSIVDGEYQYTEVDGALVNGSYLVNAAGKPVIKYYERAQLSILTAANNANVTSGKLASRLKVGGTWGTDTKENVPFMNGGRWVEQFVTVTDKYVNGEAATIYAPQVYLTSTAAAPQVAGTVYFDFCATGVILWDSRTADGKEVITCFEYVGDKLSNALTNISSEIEDIVSTTMEGVVASVGTTNAASTAGLSIKGTKTAPTVDITTGSVTTGETKLVTGGAVAAVTDALAGRIAQLEGITHFSVVVVPEGQTIENVTPLVENTIYLVKDAKAAEGTYIEYIAYKPAGSTTVVTEKIGSTAIDLSGYTTDGEHTELANRVSALDAATTGRVAVVESEISTLKTTTIPAAITEAKGYTDTTLSDALKDGGSIATAINAAKEAAIANAKVTLTAGTGITIPNTGTQDTAFTISVNTNVIATKESVDEVADAISGVSQTVASIQSQLSTGTVATGISEAKAAAQAAMEEAQKKVASVTGPTTGLVTVTGDKDVTITVSDTIATKTDAANAASTAITTSLNGTTAGTIGAAVADAKKAGTDAASALNTAKSQSLAQTGTLSDMFSVTTAGTVGTGITGITISDTGLSTAISNARTNAVADVKALTLSASDTDDTAKVTVTLGGTVETPTITVTSSDIASAQTLATLKSTVETHISEAAGLYLSVEKVDTLPADADAKTNKIYLVPVDTEEGRAQNIHTEYIWTNGQWEVIGTTAIDMNSLEAAAEAAQAAADKAQGEVDAVEEAIAAMDADLTVNGISVKQVDGKVTELSEALITASVPAGTTSVEGNVAYVGSTKHVIAPEKFQTAAQMPATLTSWVADLSNLTVGDNMFKGCTGLTVFVGDLSSLTSAVDMFNGCTLDKESLEILAENLPAAATGATIDTDATIDIGASTNATDEVKATIRGKGWTLKSNGTAL